MKRPQGIIHIDNMLTNEIINITNNEQNLILNRQTTDDLIGKLYYNTNV
jgi:ribosomal protein S11